MSLFRNPSGSLVIAVFVAAGLAGVSVASAAPEPETRAVTSRSEIRVIVTIPPLVGLMQSIAPDGVKVTGLMQPGQSEHGYEFRPSDMKALGDCDVVAYVGMGLEPGVAKFLAKGSSERRRVVVLGEVLGLQKVDDSPKPHDHKADEKGDHHGHDHDEHEAPDVHIWLDPVLVRQCIPHLADAMKHAIARRGAEWAGADKEIDDKVAATLKMVDALHERFQVELAPFRGRSIVTHHAAFGRLAARYDIKIAEVIRHFESAEPTPGQLDEVIRAIREQNVKTIFVEPQFNAKAAQRIAETAKVRLGHLDPLGDGDWFKLMETNLQELVKGLSDTPPSENATK